MLQSPLGYRERVCLSVSSTVVLDWPELSTDIFVSVFEQQDGRLVDLDGSAITARGASMVNISLKTHKEIQL